MEKTAEYRLRAAECLEAAQRARHADERAEFLAMAEAWLRLAEHRTADFVAHSASDAALIGRQPRSATDDPEQP